MFGNYLGLGSKGAKRKGPSKGAKYGVNQAKADASTKCQKCLAVGHYSYACTGKREYKVRPTRTQILNNPKLRTESKATSLDAIVLAPKEGTAAAILASNELKRTNKAIGTNRKASISSSSGSSSGSSSSSGSDSDSDSDSDSRSGSDSGSSRSRSRSPPIKRRRRSPSVDSRDGSRSKSRGARVDTRERDDNKPEKGDYRRKEDTSRVAGDRDNANDGRERRDRDR